MEGNKIMNSNKHSGTFETCTYCLRYIESGKQFGNIEGYTSTTRKLHRQALVTLVCDLIAYLADTTDKG